MSQRQGKISNVTSVVVPTLLLLISSTWRNRLEQLSQLKHENAALKFSLVNIADNDEKVSFILDFQLMLH